MKKALSALLAVCLLVGLMAPALAAEEDQNIFVTFRILGDTAHGGDFDEAHTFTDGNLTEWLLTTVFMPAGSTVADLVGQQLTKWGYTQEGLENDYITSITTPTGVTLASGTNGSASGWQYAYNYRIGDKTMSQQVLENTVTVTLFYTDDWAAEDYVNYVIETAVHGEELTENVAYWNRIDTVIHYADDRYDSYVVGLQRMVTYAVKDENGYETNYIRARDLAKIFQERELNTRFNVTWDQETQTINFQTRTDYVPLEGNDEVPFYASPKNYEPLTAGILVDGEEVKLDAILLKDGLGRGYTYYKLRDLGDALGFLVGWSPKEGVMIFDSSAN